MRHQATPTLLQRALEHLTRREHSRQELHDKLQRWVQALETAASIPRGAVSSDCGNAPVAAPRPAAEDVDALLDQLQRDGLLSDTRFVESRVQARAARHGNRRIEHELRQHGAELPPALREELKVSESDRARAVWARKFGQLPADPAERGRQMRFLAGRGFTADAIQQVLRAGAETD